MRNRGFYIASTICLVACAIVPGVAAALTYTPLLPGFPQVTVAEGSGDFAGYINTIITIGIGLIGVLAVLMIIIGGIQYVSTDSWQNKDSGKKRIQAALGGLLLALSSYLILNTIDSSLTTLNFADKLKPVNLPTASSSLIVGSTGAVSSTSNPNSPGKVVDPSIPVSSTGTPGERPINESLTKVPGGYEVTPYKVSMDNDGRAKPPFYDATWQNQTSCKKNGEYLDAGVDVFVVVPLNSPFPCHTPVTIRNNTTGQSISAFVGDRGPGYGEMSRAAARALGLWTPDMVDEIKTKADGSRYNITYTFHTE